MQAVGYAGRPAAVRAALEGATLVVSTPSNIRWLTSFGGSLGWVIIGPDRFALVTDAMGAAGAADGDYVLGPAAVQVRDRVARLTDGGAIAGSTLTMDRALRYAVTVAKVPLDLAVEASSATPAVKV